MKFIVFFQFLGAPLPSQLMFEKGKAFSMKSTIILRKPKMTLKHFSFPTDHAQSFTFLEDKQFGIL